MYRVKFLNPQQVRMASPFNITRLEVTGDYVPPALADDEFQDKAAISKDGGTCFLIRWKFLNASPGFFVWKVLEKERKLLTSEHVDGGCLEIGLTPDESGVELKVWRTIENVKFTRRLQ